MPVPSATPVDESAQAPKQPRHPVNLVEDDQHVRVILEIQFRLRQLREVRLGLQVEVDGGALPAYLVLRHQPLVRQRAPVLLPGPTKSIVVPGCAVVGGN